MFAENSKKHNLREAFVRAVNDRPGIFKWDKEMPQSLLIASAAPCAFIGRNNSEKELKEFVAQYFLGVELEGPTVAATFIYVAVLKALINGEEPHMILKTLANKKEQEPFEILRDVFGYLNDTKRKT